MRMLGLLVWSSSVFYITSRTIAAGKQAKHCY